TVEPKSPKRWQTALRLILLSILTLSLLASGFSTSHSPAHNQTMSTRQEVNASLAPVIGSRTTIVILIQFPDKTNSTSPSKISDMLTGLNSYYSEDSDRKSTRLNSSHVSISYAV